MTTPLSPALSYPGFKVVLMGPPGTGKTYALSTLAATGLEVFCAFLEPGVETLIGAFIDPPPRGQGLKAVPANVHWHYLQGKHRNFGAMQAMAQKVGQLDLKALANYRDPQRSQYNRFEALYGVLNNFVDQNGKSFGPVDEWGNDRVLCLDGTTGLGQACLEMMVGEKPVYDKPDFGIAQNNMRSFVDKLVNGCRCHFVLIAHVERLVDEVQGGVKLMPSTPGKAMQATFAQPFSDVILTKREGPTWYWDTADSTADLKTRNLPLSSKLPPSFTAIYSTWKARRDAAFPA